MFLQNSRLPCCRLVDRAEESLEELEQAGVAPSSMIQSLIAHARRQIDQVERRLLKGETIAHDEKVFSIFEEHTRWVSKGKAGCAVPWVCKSLILGMLCLPLEVEYLLM